MTLKQLVYIPCISDCYQTDIGKCDNSMDWLTIVTVSVHKQKLFYILIIQRYIILKVVLKIKYSSEHMDRMKELSRKVSLF